MAKNFNLKLLKYEIINTSSNMFTIIFSICLPLFLTILFSFIFSSEVPIEARAELNASLYRKMLMIIPLALMLIGHSSNFAQETESGSYQRFLLFGYKEWALLLAKLIANLFFLTLAIVIYTTVIFLALDVAAPTALSFILLIVFVYVFACILLILSHSIATIYGRFGPTFGTTMALYFIFMILGGMMGASVNEFPSGLKFVAKLLPLYYIDSSYGNFWQGNSFNFLPVVLSLFGLLSVSLMLYFWGIKLNKKGNRKSPPIYWE